MSPSDGSPLKPATLSIIRACRPLFLIHIAAGDRVARVVLLLARFGQ